jgi:hypothetical protein
MSFIASISIDSGIFPFLSFSSMAEDGVCQLAEDERGAMLTLG